MQQHLTSPRLILLLILTTRKPPTIATPQATFLKNCDLNDCLSNKDDNSTFTGTKVIGTIGPACQDPNVLSAMLKAGMVGARVDFTAGRLAFHRKSLENLQVASKETQKLCCIIADTQGRTIVVKREGQVDELGWPYYPTLLEVSSTRSQFSPQTSPQTSPRASLPLHLPLHLLLPLPLPLSSLLSA